MSAACPHGHASTDPEWCSECGAEMAPAEASHAAADPLEEVEHTDTVVSGATTCPNPTCGSPIARGDRFCEECGHDVTVPYVAAPDDRPWLLTVAVDRATWERLAPEGVGFPEGATPRTTELTGDEVHVGRGDAERGVCPDIDLGGDHADPGVSRRHATLRRNADGVWTVTDLGSANGTWHNDNPDPIAPGVPVTLHEGDRVQLGAFTVLELLRAQ